MSRPVAIGRPFALGRQPWKTLDPFLFCVYHDDQYPKGHGATLGPSPAELRGRDLTSDFSYKDGWSMYHGTVVPGFPSHPHRGFETITYTMKGLVDHFDSLGATGRYGNGDVQWLTTGDGVQHSEMFPLVNDKEPNPLELFQIWLNLPRAKKTAPPFFEMLWKPEIPVATSGDAEVTVVAGHFHDTVPKNPPPNSWAATAENEVAVWIVRIKKENGKVVLPPAAGGEEINRVLYYFKGSAGSVAVGGSDPVRVAKSQGLQLNAGVPAEIAAVDGVAEVLILQGRPIKEPVVQRGPFVVTSSEELQETFRKFQQTEFGGWPWPSPDHHHPQSETRFAKRPGQDAREYPPSQ